MMAIQKSGTANRLITMARGAIPSNNASCSGSRPSSSQSWICQSPGLSWTYPTSSKMATARNESQKPAE